MSPVHEDRVIHHPHHAGLQVSPPLELLASISLFVGIESCTSVSEVKSASWDQTGVISKADLHQGGLDCAGLNSISLMVLFFSRAGQHLSISSSINQHRSLPQKYPGLEVMANDSVLSNKGAPGVCRD